MPREYDDPVSPEAIAAAVAQALELRRTAPDAPIEAHIETAVHQCICACAVAIEDAVEGVRSGLHEAVAQEVRRQVEARLSPQPRPERAGWDAVDQASDESFPASDPPSWIWQRPGD